MARKSIKDKASRNTPAARRAKGPKRTGSQTISVKAPKGLTPLWEKLEKSWSLVQCKRAIALACEHNSVASKLAEIREQRKSLRDEWHEEHDASTAKKILALEDEAKTLKQRQKAIVADVLRLALESVGGDLFQDDGEDASAVRDIPGQGRLDDQAHDERPVGVPSLVASGSTETVAP